jgi:hypothetical protein
MNEKTSPETQGIADALDAVLSAIIEERAARKTAEGDYGWPSVPTVGKLKTRDQSRIERIAANARLGSLYLAVYWIGLQLHGAGMSSAQMADFLDEVCARHPESHGRRAAIVDARWNGIGEWLS